VIIRDISHDIFRGIFRFLNDLSK